MIVVKGNHHELLALKGHYYMLVVAQTVSNEAQNAVLNENTTEGNGVTRESLVGATEPGSTTVEDGHLIMRDVHFCYPTRKRNMVFNGLNLTVRRGETLAIVGPSGGGKSTIVSLIERFYDPSSGSIQLDGIDLRDLNVKFLRDQLGLVSQEATLFDATIGENIRYGNPSATQEEIEDAARRANAHDFITSFPDGYNTYCGERGTQVSGGQKQRIAIARAILKPRQILLLDEATSALDSESEQVVQAALDKLMGAKSQTAIVVAHRLSTLRCADRIAVIADGKVREIGTHDELLSKPNGRYKRLSMFQSLDGGGNTDIKSLMAAAVKDLEKEEWAKKKMHEDAVELEDEQRDEDEENGTDAEKSNIHRARLLAKDDLSLLFIGASGALLAGLVFPACGVSTNALQL
jgi:ATP-binding cassette subfamily B (MDR/TAP) protein 1